MENQNIKIEKLHPHKFILWVAIGSITMMFAALTSAYIVKKNQTNFLEFDLPIMFILSTITIIASSLTIQLSLKYSKSKEREKFRFYLLATLILGILFIIFQFVGFVSLQNKGIFLLGIKSNPAASFLLVIVGLHAFHILGGIIAIGFLLFKIYFGSTKIYSQIPIEVINIYWHFVDILWIYLFAFLHFIK